MDRGSSHLQNPWQSYGAADGCRSCALLQSVARQSPEETAFIVEHANDAAVVLRGPQLSGLVVVPRQCVNTLQDLSVVGRGQVLAAVRVATLAVRTEILGSTSRIEVLRDDSATPDCHVSYQVVPDVSRARQQAPEFAHR
jgi:hypothetical protein